MMLFIHGKTPMFHAVKFKEFLQNHCGLSFSLTRFAVGKLRAGEQVALNIYDLPDSTVVDELGILYEFQP